MIMPECVTGFAGIRGRDSEINNFKESHSVDNGGEGRRINGNGNEWREWGLANIGMVPANKCVLTDWHGKC